MVEIKAIRREKVIAVYVVDTSIMALLALPWSSAEKTGTVGYPKRLLRVSKNNVLPVFGNS